MAGYRHHTRRTFLTVAGGMLAMTGTTEGRQLDQRHDVTPELQDATGQTDVVLRLERAAETIDTEMPRPQVIQHLKRHAAETQRLVRAQLAPMDGVDVTRSFWLANALGATVDLDTVSLETLTELEYVECVHSPELPGNRPRPDSSVPSQSDGNVFEERDVSWAVELVNAPAVWEQYDSRGEGARICIIDTGVDPDHPDIDLDGWAEFDRQGQRVESEPNEPSPDEAPIAGHGTGMSSVATGGDASGMQIGVAPEAELYVAGFETYNFPAVMAGLEWAVENDADVASMSFTMDGQWGTVIEPFENAVDAGTLPITISEWPLPFIFNATTPAVLTTGSLDKTLSPRKGSNGGYVRWDRALRNVETPEWWPAESFTPDLTLAGAEVPNAIPLELGAYFDYIDEDAYGPNKNWATMPGVSNTAPATAGVIALLLSATDQQLSPAEIRESVPETAVQPFDSDLPIPNDQYGHGIPHAARLVHKFVDPERTVSGTVVDDAGDPVEGAVVATRSGDETTTDSDGSYTVSIPQGSDALFVRALGYEPAQQSLDFDQSTADVALETPLEPQLDIAQDYPTRLDPGSTLTVEVPVRHANSALVEIESEGRRVGADDVELRIDGTTTQPGDPVDFPLETETLSLQFRFDDAARGMLESKVVVANTDGEVTTAKQAVEPVHVHEQPMTVSEGDPLEQSLGVAAPDTTVELAGDEWVVETTPADMDTPEVLLNSDNRVVYTNPVLAPAQDDPTGLLVDRALTLTAADGSDPTIRIEGDTNSDRSVGIRVAASYVTISDIEVDAGGATSGIHVLNSVGADINAVTVSNARDAILGELTISLLVRSCDLTGTEHGIRISWLGWNSQLADNEIRADIAGVALDSDFIIARARLSGNQFEDVGTDVVTRGEGEISYEQESTTDEEDDSDDESESDDESGTSESTPEDAGEETSGDSSTETTEEETDSTETDEDDSDADGGGPGFGVTTTLAGLGGIGYLVSQRLGSDEDQ